MQVRKPAPKWSGPAVLNNEFVELSSDKYIGTKGKWVVLFFYPLVMIPPSCFPCATLYLANIIHESIRGCDIPSNVSVSMDFAAQ